MTVNNGKLSEEEARKIVDRLYAQLLARGEERVTRGRFMSELAEGKISRESIKTFWLNWHNFVAEVNNFAQCAYQRHLGFFLQHLDLMTPFADKVADELIHPKAPGHLLMVWKQGEVFGLTRDQMVNYPTLPECRGLLDWLRGLLYEGTMAEFWSSFAAEEYVGHWAQAFRLGLKKMGYTAQQLVYFKAHEEADLQEHEGVMGHGEFNRAVLRRLLTTGNVSFRPGYSLEYCTTTSIDLYALLVDRCVV
jgi:pyrroloquinoline quinone (PQQ) biosynthesis protein C